MKQFDVAETRAALDFPSLIEALRKAFAEGASVPLRHTHQIESRGAVGTTLIMPAWNEEGYFGVKTINIFPGNGEKGLPGLHATYMLYDATTGVPLALIDGDEITVKRTAGAAALGADYLARPDARRLLVLGTGRIASLIPAAMKAVRPIEQVVVWNHRTPSADALVARLRDAGFDARRAGDLERAVREADIVSCATLSTVPLVRGVWLQPGTHLDLIGSFKPDMKETDPDCFIGTEVFVDTDEAPKKSGDLLAAMATGRFAMSDIRATLEMLCRGEHPGRTAAEAVTVFKAVGSALEDLTAAMQVYRKKQSA